MDGHGMPLRPHSTLETDDNTSMHTFAISPKYSSSCNSLIGIKEPEIENMLKCGLRFFRYFIYLTRFDSLLSSATPYSLKTADCWAQVVNKYFHQNSDQTWSYFQKCIWFYFNQKYINDTTLKTFQCFIKTQLSLARDYIDRGKVNISSEWPPKRWTNQFLHNQCLRILTLQSFRT